MHHHVLRFGKRVAIAIAGGAVLLAGVAMLVLPGPAIVVIPLGLGILSLEFERPRVWLAQLKARAVDLKHRLQARRSQRRDG
jgi:tellurite resistance protein TerC